jgi:A-factor type gamma-butyrolactone 1'-reductase (1S-forming)
MSKQFENKVVLITGGNSGIGQSTAVAFAEEGATVIIGGRNEQKGKKVLEILKNTGAKSQFINVDVSKSNEVKKLIEKAVEIFGKIDIAFNCGGIDGVKKPLIQIEDNEWDEVIDTNLKGTFLLLKYEIIQMLKQNTPATIVNMASVSGILGRPNRAPYNSSRSGVIGLTKTAAVEYIRKGIRINAVAPASVKTELFDNYTKNDPATQAQYAEGMPIGRICTPEEVADSVLWLCSDKSSFVVGHTLVLDGGFTLV